MSETTIHQARMLAAYEAALAISSIMDPGEVLERIVRLAREVVPARYAALGVADSDGRVHTFITSGITLQQRRALGDIPEGHGLIGELIRTRKPLMIPDISEDSRSVGFPENHPPHEGTAWSSDHARQPGAGQSLPD